MIYDSITRQSVEVIGHYPIQNSCYRFGRKLEGVFQFVRVRYGEHLPGFSGGYPIGTEKDVDVNYLVADDGVREINAVVKSVPLILEEERV